MQKKLLSNIALLMLVNLMVKPFWILGIDRQVQNAVGYEVYGLYANMFGLSMILTMLLDFGINNFNSSTIARDPDRLKTQFSSLIWLKLGLSGCYFLATLAMAWFYGYSGHLLWLVCVLALNQVIAWFTTFIRSNISGLQRFKTDAWLSSVDRFVMILLGLALLTGGIFPLTLAAFAYIQLAGYMAAFLVSLAALGRDISGVQIRFDRQLIAGIMRKTYPYALLALIMLLYTRLDVLLIKKLVPEGDRENGVYASGGRLLEAANMMVGAITAILLPFFSRMISGNTDLTPLSRTIAAVILLPVMLFATGCHSYSEAIMQWLSPGSSSYTAAVFSILILCFIPYSFMYIFGSMLTAKAEMRVLNLVCLLALLVNIAMNIWLIPRYGAWGAAISALCTQCVVGFGKMTFAVKRIRLVYQAGDYLKLFGFLGTALAGFKILHYFETGIIYAFLLMSVWMSAWILVLKMVEVRRLKEELISYIRGGKA